MANKRWLAFRSDEGTSNLSAGDLALRITDDTGLNISAAAYTNLVGEVLGREFGSTAAFAEFLNTADIRSVPCSVDLITHLENSRINADTKGVGWFSRGCHPGENLLVWKDGDTLKPFAWARCLNIARVKMKKVAGMLHNWFGTPTLSLT